MPINGKPTGGKGWLRGKYCRKKITLSHTQWCAGHSMVVERTASTRSPDEHNPLVLDLISGIPESRHLSRKFIPFLLRWSLFSALWGRACDLLMKQHRQKLLAFSASVIGSCLSQACFYRFLPPPPSHFQKWLFPSFWPFCGRINKTSFTQTPQGKTKTGKEIRHTKAFDSKEKIDLNF